MASDLKIILSSSVEGKLEGILGGRRQPRKSWILNQEKQFNRDENENLFGHNSDDMETTCAGYGPPSALSITTSQICILAKIFIREIKPATPMK